jgi:cytochrome c553
MGARAIGQEFARFITVETLGAARLLAWLFVVGAAAFPGSQAMAEPPTAAAAEFFEKRVRPLLTEHCFPCHGEAKTKGHLRLDSRNGILKGGDSGPAAVIGSPQASLLMHVIRYQDEPKMPPKGKLRDADIATLTAWVEKGLPWPEAKPTNVTSHPGREFQITEEQRRFWSFQPVANPIPPAVKNRSWPHSPIDRFVLARLETNALHPASAAGRPALIRRATFDLTGLPPTPEEVESFLTDQAPGAFGRVVDRLLASPHYGEHWGRHWLDVVRYTDSFDARITTGPGKEMDISEAWRYRDWVVDALNRDLPYTRFLIDQIAGDLLPASLPSGINAAGLTATGFLAIGNWGGGDADKEKLLTDIADDQVDVVARTFMGLTLACARCHDHKFDPLSTADYYGLAGMFFSTHILPNVGPKTNGPPMLRIPLASKTEIDKRNRVLAQIAELDKQLKAAKEAAAQAKLRAELQTLRNHPSLGMAFVHGAQEGGVPGSPHAGVHDVRIHIRGSYARLGELVPRHFPTILAGERQPAIKSGSGRLELARWLASPEHPLTARVMVNRIWQHHFGEGLVRTPSNFGKLGEPPTHPELLDYLAGEFVRGGWSLKQMHRTIMLSAAYQQSSEPPAETLRIDPDNRLWGRMNRRRLEAEAIRDNLLAVSGRLDRRLRGKASGDFANPRRTLYHITIRSDRSGFGPLFDMADSTAPAEKRAVSTVAPQALFFLNHPFVLEQTRALAGRTWAQPTRDEAERIDFVYRLLFSRPAAPEEIKIGEDFLASRKGSVQTAWTEYLQILLCSNEFVFVD